MSDILIIVDAQKGFITQCSSHVLEKLNTLQHQFKHVIFTKFYNPDPLPFRNILDYQKLTPGHSDTDLALTAREDAVIIERPLYTCATQELCEYLTRLQAREVYVCGVATEACVLKTVIDLFELNIRPYVIEDICASDQGEHYHNIAIELMKKLVGKEQVIKAEQLNNLLHIQASKTL
ncbi:MAG TPA: isochorismatase family cysteine hydrolase [Rickettsiales bacterium]|nr:isochorismatase family cysteine hydrolase [Rickettsiales bacterium]